MKDLFLNKSTYESNKDAPLGHTDRLKYLQVIKNAKFESSFPPFQVTNVGGINVIDESKSCEVGAKARFGEFYMSTIKQDEIVYVQPRQGFAGISLAYLCKKFNKKLTLIMPSSKEASHHQRLCIELGANPRFVRIAAMPNANHIAEKYAKKVNACYVPLGLRHPHVTAGAVHSLSLIHI